MFTTWRWLRDWGATAAERWMILHGDELIPDPGDMTTLAVPIEAPAADVLAAATTRRMLLGVNARAERGRRVARSVDAAPAAA
jgi:hypothetical protein